MNTNSALKYAAALSGGTYRLRVAAGTLYRLRVNGEVTAYGPARAPHGYARVDEIPLVLKEALNRIEFEVVHYSAKSFYMPLAPAFFSAEVKNHAGDIVLATDDFAVADSGHRDFEVEKFTYQRHLMESYDYTRVFKYEIAEPPGKPPVFLERGAPLPELKRIFPAKRLEHGAVIRPGNRAHSLKPAEELAAYYWRNDGGSGYSLYDFGRIVTGFIKLELYAETESELLVGFDELYEPGGYPGKRAWWGNYFLRLKLKAGQALDFESFEVYTLRYLAAWVLEGAVKIKKVESREYAFPQSELSVPDSIARSRIGRAAVETFRQNTVDVFMDCPGRERAAWLCDSFFMARAAFLLTGSTRLEETFIENFLLPGQFEGLPAGMFPMCYPADTENFIPQWGMWLILEIDDYLQARKGQRRFQHEFKGRFDKFREFFAPYFNAAGLLENLPGWNFIEWSRANEFVHGVHYPTNLLYARCLEVMSGWYGDPRPANQADAIRRTVRRLGFNGKRLWDNDSGKCTSEIAQYFALLFGGKYFRDIDMESAPDTPAALFIGKFLRFELLLKRGQCNKLRRELLETFSPMARQTGTLWEKTTPDASCCHGFASYVAVLLHAATQEKTLQASSDLKSHSV